MIEAMDSVPDLWIVVAIAVLYIIADIIKIAMDESEGRKNGDLSSEDRRG